MDPDNVGKATSLLRGVSAGDPNLANWEVCSEGFVQHDPSVADGVVGMHEQARRSAGDGHLLIARVLEDEPFVVVHGRNDAGNKGEVFFAVFRFEDGLLVEHWRFAAAVASPNESGHTQIDGPSKPDGGQDTARSKALVRDYYETVHIGRKHDRIGHYMSGDLQIRHEPGARDGVAAFEQDLAVLTRSRTIDEIVLFAGQGDLVFIAAKGTHEGEPCAYIDLYRVEAGKLVEHWGFPQAIPPQEESKNGNGML